MLIGSTHKARSSAAVRQSGHRSRIICTATAGVLLAESEARIMARCDIVGPFGKGSLRKRAKLDSLVTHDVGVGGIPVSIGIKQIVNDRLFVFLLAVPYRQINTKRDGHALRIGQIVCPRAMESGKILRPVTHIHRMNVKALFQKKCCRKRRVDAAAHA